MRTIYYQVCYQSFKVYGNTIEVMCEFSTYEEAEKYCIKDCNYLQLPELFIRKVYK